MWSCRAPASSPGWSSRRSRSRSRCLGMGALILEMREDLGKSLAGPRGSRARCALQHQSAVWRDRPGTRRHAPPPAVPIRRAARSRRSGPTGDRRRLLRGRRSPRRPDRRGTGTADRRSRAGRARRLLLPHGHARGSRARFRRRAPRGSDVRGDWRRDRNRLWPGADPIGRRLASISPTRRGTSFTVVGVVDETRAGLRDAGDEIRVFVPDLRITGGFLIRTQAPAQPMLPVIRAMAVAEAPDLPIVSARTSTRSHPSSGRR